MRAYIFYGSRHGKGQDRCSLIMLIKHDRRVDLHARVVLYMASAGSFVSLKDLHCSALFKEQYGVKDLFIATVRKWSQGRGSRALGRAWWKLQLAGQEEILLMCPFLLDGHAYCSFYWGAITFSEDILYEIKVPKLGESRRTLGCVIVFSERFCSTVGLEPASYVCK